MSWVIIGVRVRDKNIPKIHYQCMKTYTKVKIRIFWFWAVLNFSKKCCILIESCTISLFDTFYPFCTMKQSDLVWWDTVAEKQLLIWPMVSLIAWEWQDRQSQAIAISKIAIIRANIDTILQKASVTLATLWWKNPDFSIRDILQWAYIVKEAWKWSLYGEEIKMVREFVQKIVQEIQFSKERTHITPIASNEKSFKIAA